MDKIQIIQKQIEDIFQIMDGVFKKISVPKIYYSRVPYKRYKKRIMKKKRKQGMIKYCDFSNGVGIVIGFGNEQTDKEAIVGNPGDVLKRNENGEHYWGPVNE